jgi:putative transposase
LIISDAWLGLVEAAAEVFPHARWQRCVVHWYRNAFAKAPRTKVTQLALMLKAIHASESRAAAEMTAERVRATLDEVKLSKLSEWISATVGETLTYHRFPDKHWRKIRTNNPLERLLREIRRRRRVVGVFPDGESALNLAATRLRYMAGTAWSMRRYLNMKLLEASAGAVA